MKINPLQRGSLAEKGRFSRNLVQKVRREPSLWTSSTSDSGRRVHHSGSSGFGPRVTTLGPILVKPL